MREATNVNKTGTLRATGAFSFIPEGRTYSPLVTRAVVSFPKVRLVRSPRGKNPIGFYRHLRMRLWTMLHSCGNAIIVHAVVKAPSVLEVPLPTARINSAMNKSFGFVWQLYLRL